MRAIHPRPKATWKKQLLVCLDYLNQECVIAKICDVVNKQIIISFLNRDGEHLTIHKQNDSPRLLLTHSSKHVTSKSGMVKIEAARRCGYRNPERHANYLIHDEIYFEDLNVPILSMGMSYSDCEYPIPCKYSKLPKIHLGNVSRDFSLEIYFTYDEADFQRVPFIPITTSLGYILLGIK